MCGIVGYLGKKSAAEVIVEGLRTLEYRGYDSAGLALIDPSDQPKIIKQIGRVEALASELASKDWPPASIAIGHTRWATHGAPNVANAHPHCNKDKTIFVVHNGIIENYTELKAQLQKTGYKFISETDSEVIPHLIDYYLKQTSNFTDAFASALKDLSGAYAVVAMTTLEPKKLFAARLSSPLVLGLNGDEFVIASDPSAIGVHTKQVVFLEDYEMAVIGDGKHEISDFRDRRPIDHAAELIDFDDACAALGDYPNFMLKEINEAPGAIKNASLGRIKASTGTVKLGGLEGVSAQLGFIDRLVIVACGTSYYAGLVGEYLIEELAGLPVEVQLASEFKYRSEPFSRGTALLAISQSGETADTIAALKKVEDYGVLRLGVVNAPGSTIARMTDAGVYCHAGPELAVASTKAFIAQVTVLLEIALHLSQGNTPLFKPLLEEIEALPKKAEQVIALAPQIEKLARKYQNYRDFLFIGRGYGYPTALEGALKLKEISYIHAEAYAAGEIKHGPLAMIDANFPTIALAESGDQLNKTISNIEEIRARGGPVLAISDAANQKIASVASDTLFIPKTLAQTAPILEAIVLQLFAYYIASGKKLDIDRPRNLAKSVTVE